MPDTTLRVSGEVTAARDALRTLVRDIRGVDQALERAGRRPLISAEQTRALQDVGRASQIAGAGIVALGTFAVRGAAQLESLSLGLETVFGSAEAAAQIFEELQTAAARTPFELPDLARGASNLKAFGISAGDVIPRLLQLGDLSRGQTDEFRRLINAYGQAAANQRLLREELNRFIEAGVPILGRAQGHRRGTAGRRDQYGGVQRRDQRW